jgi:hypothetical protein
LSGDDPDALALRRFQAALRKRRWVRQAASFHRPLEVACVRGDDCLPKLLAVSDALEWLTVDPRAAAAYLRVEIAATSPHIDAGLRKQLKALARRAYDQLRRASKIREPRGRKQKLSPGQEKNVSRVYRGLLAFFQEPAHRPQPEEPDDKRLLETINAELSRLLLPRRLTLAQLERLTEETSPNRIAKAVTGAVYGVSLAQVDKIVSRVGRSPRQ